MRSDTLLVHAARNGQKEPSRGVCRAEPLRRPQHGWKEALDLLTATARKEQNRHIIRTDAEVMPCLCRRHLGTHRIDERIANERDVRPRRLVGRQLMRENRDDLIGEGRAGLRAPLTPCPCRRRNIRKDGNSPLLCPRRQPPVKIRIVDDDEHIGMLLVHQMRQIIKQRENSAEIQNHRRNPHHIVVRIILTERHSRRSHLRTAEADQLHRRVQCAQFTR